MGFAPSAYLLKRGFDDLVQIGVWDVREQISQHISCLGIDSDLRGVRVAVLQLFIIANIIKGHCLPGRRQIQTQLHANTGNNGTWEMIPNPMHMLRKVVAMRMRSSLNRKWNKQRAQGMDSRVGEIIAYRDGKNSQTISSARFLASGGELRITCRDKRVSRRRFRFKRDLP